MLFPLYGIRRKTAIGEQKEKMQKNAEGGLSASYNISLIAGWYGMNFTHMPELSAPYAYFILIGVCILIVAVEIWYFKKKGWF